VKRKTTRRRGRPERKGGKNPNPPPRKARTGPKKSHQNVLRQKERPSRPMKRSVSALTSFRNAGIDLRCLATRVPIGSKPSDSSSPKQGRAKVGRLTLIARPVVLPRARGDSMNRPYL